MEIVFNPFATILLSLRISVPEIISELASSRSLLASASDAPPILSPSVKSAVVNANLLPASFSKSTTLVVSDADNLKPFSIDTNEDEASDALISETLLNTNAI